MNEFHPGLFAFSVDKHKDSDHAISWHLDLVKCLNIILLYDNKI